MPHFDPTDCWRVVTLSERGEAHKRLDLPNQDAVCGFVSPDRSVPVILAAADGHGSEKCSRSNIGAAEAVKATHQVLREFLVAAADKPIPEAKRIAKQQVPGSIIRVWQRNVRQHLRSNPITDEGHEQSGAAHDAAPNDDGDARPLEPYGTTLLGALITDEFALYLQLGDGEILVVSDGGTEVNHPIAEDARLIANETTSLCQHDPLPDFRVVFHRVEHVRPVLVLLTTDGFPNSFSDPVGLVKFVPELLARLRNDPDGTIGDYLPGLLHRASDEGSGDDITLAIAYTLIPAPSGADPAIVEARPALQEIAPTANAGDRNAENGALTANGGQEREVDAHEEGLPAPVFASPAASALSPGQPEPHPTSGGLPPTARPQAGASERAIAESNSDCAQARGPVADQSPRNPQMNTVNTETAVMDGELESASRAMWKRWAWWKPWGWGR